MGFYRDVIYPAVMDRMMSDPDCEVLRVEALAGARGRVVEIGFGTALNLPHYPKEVERLVGVDPNPGVNKRAAARVGKAAFPVEICRASAESLPQEDASFDTVVCSFSLCGIPDGTRALREARRVMRDDGRLIVLEHGLSDDPKIRTWQRRLSPINAVLAAGCRLDRDIRGMVERGGFAFDALRTTQMTGAPKPFGYVYLGSAAKA